jgi:hypothetical protein
VARAQLRLLGPENSAAVTDLDAAGRFAPEQAIADYDAALRLQPHSAWSLYGRGLAKVRNGLASAGEQDIAAATAIQPRIEDEARQHGITR